MSLLTLKSSKKEWKRGNDIQVKNEDELEFK